MFFFMNLLWNQYNNIARNELNNYTKLTFLLVQPWFGPYDGTTVHTWLVFLTTVLKVLIRDDFPAALYPITRILRAWLCSGTSISTIPSKRWFFFFNWRRKKVFQNHYIVFRQRQFLIVAIRMSIQWCFTSRVFNFYPNQTRTSYTCTSV